MGMGLWIDSDLCEKWAFLQLWSDFSPSKNNFYPIVGSCSNTCVTIVPICNAQCAVWVSEMLLNVNSRLLWSNLCYKGEKGVGNFLMPEKFPITLQPIWCSLMH